MRICCVKVGDALTCQPLNNGMDGSNGQSLREVVTASVEVQRGKRKNFLVPNMYLLPLQSVGIVSADGKRCSSLDVGITDGVQFFQDVLAWATTCSLNFISGDDRRPLSVRQLAGTIFFLPGKQRTLSTTCCWPTCAVNVLLLFVLSLAVIVRACQACSGNFASHSFNMIALHGVPLPRHD